MIGNKQGFDLDHLVHELKHYLPSQAPLKDFIHHNTLHAFQGDPFHTALVKANRIFGYKTYLNFGDYQQMFHDNKISREVLEKVIRTKKGEENMTYWLSRLFEARELNYTAPRIGSLRECWKEKYKFDLDVRVHPFLFRLLASYLDQGVSVWNFPGNSKDFMKSLRDLEKKSLIGLLKSPRAKKLLLTPKLQIEKLLEILVGDESLFETYTFDQQFAHPGWSGIVSVIEDNPGTLLDKRSLSLVDLIKIELLMEIDALDTHFGEIWAPLGSKVKVKPPQLFSPVRMTKNDELKEIWQEAYEWSYYDQVICALKNQEKNKSVPAERQFQALFCIDDRECSIRRYIEQTVPGCETFSTAGHFNVEFYYQPEHGKFFTKVCPAPLTPKFLVQEKENKSKKKRDFHFNRRSHSLVTGWFLTHTIGLWSGIRLALSIFKPQMNAATSSSSLHMDPAASLTIENKDPNHTVNGLQVGFTVTEMTDRVEGLLKSIGLVTDFAPIVYAIGHGSTSVNNTHYAGYDCGACSGRPGSVNARTACFMANHPEVRKGLAERGIQIPDSTQFVGALHDTSRDEITYFDTAVLHESNKALHLKNVQAIEIALDKNAKERSRRFESISSNADAKKVHRKVKTRSVSLFEPRPELNHATNALTIVGRRSFTRQIFLDRRAFLNSFDYRVDPEGKYLLGILHAVAPVCGGINLEYYFSRVDNHNLGAGTKLPHNVMGLLGVANGTDGDLRTGLPQQMIEVHDPVRLLVIVEHFPEIVLRTIKTNPQTYNWFEKNWVKLVACNPETNEFFEFRDGKFLPYETVQDYTETVSDPEKLIMQHEDNLPVFYLKQNSL
ncbi:MAG: hypothetical protein K0R65_512 [Crocinitomicaceae bacterium]|jgi:uncharacterized protein YbcC (UPF0753/DUF2309 family)|nr:hypothetical protein [Crocinitomicaceae bacterium]